jgi:hypothetical protein
MDDGLGGIFAASAGEKSARYHNLDLVAQRDQLARSFSRATTNIKDATGFLRQSLKQKIGIGNLCCTKIRSANLKSFPIPVVQVLGPGQPF